MISLSPLLLVSVSCRLRRRRLWQRHSQRVAQEADFTFRMFQTRPVESMSLSLMAGASGSSCSGQVEADVGQQDRAAAVGRFVLADRAPQACAIVVSTVLAARRRMRGSRPSATVTMSVVMLREAHVCRLVVWND